jgi:hypothetical protein
MFSWITRSFDLEGHLSDSDIILTVRCTQSSEEVRECIKYLIPTIIQAQMHYNELRQFIESKLEVSDELFEALNEIERFTTNATINIKTQTKINTFFK